MQKEEYEKLFTVETSHWFYKGKRAIVKYWIEQLKSLNATDVLIDVGAGTGHFVGMIEGKCLAYGVEPSLEALHWARQGAHHHAIIQGTIDRIPFKSASADIVTSMDVLEHIEDDLGALKELIRITKPGGLIILTIPALKFAWSDWDVALGHYRRYHRRDITTLVKHLPVSIVHLNYINTVMCLPAIVYRWVRQFLSIKDSRMEDVMPSPWLNKLLYNFFVVPARWKIVKMPMGLSILVVLRKAV